MSDYLLEYMKAHLISVEQDLENVDEEMNKLDENSKDYKDLEFEYNWLSGQIIVARHFIEVAEDHAATR